ncbi:MAG: prepilin-type N-terminal cleavage/methylation domain-containing protein [Ruminococcus sp.]|nr:prepilin-type N-terminal cleavage/methylation domain-containing protein [Ruminococcus sp.]
MNKKLKGFTLTELIIVIAIIGILSALLVPSYMGWIVKSRIREQNNNAKIIFNAAQTVVQDYRFKERKMEDSKKNIGSGKFEFYWDKNTGASASGDASKVTDTAFINEFARQVNRIYADQSETTYKIYVENYMVKSVVSASGNSNRHKGSYPTKQDSINSTTIQGFDMSTIVLS